MICNIDIETYSAAKIKDGVYAYAEHPSTEILVVCWSLDNGPVQHWTNWGSGDLDPFIDILEDESIELRAYNAQFERTLLNSRSAQCLGIPNTAIPRWRCTAVQAAMHALPRALGDCAQTLGTHPKDEAGKTAMLALSKPRTAGKMKGRPWTYEDRPDDFQALLSYCEDDVRAEQAIANRLPHITKDEQINYHLDQKINDRGITIDKSLAYAITAQWPAHKAELDKECRNITGGIGVTQVKSLTPWLGLPDLTANRIRDTLAKGGLKPEIEQVLKLRAEASKTSVTKFNTMLRAVCEDDRLRGMFLFDGAQTGRWTGRIVQLHNLPRNTADQPQELIDRLYANANVLTGDMAQQLIRPTFCNLDTGLLVGDYASIELRVALWFAGSWEHLAKIRSGVDMYKDLAALIYGKSIDEINKTERFVGKQAVLGLGYGMGAKKFADYCASQGEPIDFGLAERTVSIYRDEYKSIYQTWWAMENAAAKAVRSPGKPFTVCDGKIKYVVRGDFLYCVLPSGRPIAYPYPKIEPRETPWGGETASITFMGVNQYTRKWERLDTFGGRLFENVCQGTAACLLRNSLRILDDNNFDIVAHVHDEAIADGTADRLDEFTELMTLTPDWADGLPVAVEAVHTFRYLK